MKKLMGYIAVVALVLTFTACGNKDNEVINNNPPVNDEINVENNNETENKEEVNNEQENNVQEENKTEDNKEQDKLPENKPVENKPDEDKKPENKPAENKPVEDNKPVEELPAEKPQEDPKPEEPTSNSVGSTLLKEFNEKAASATSVLELAETLVQNPIIQFMGGAMEVEEGYLSGFDNTEIKGFKSGAMFAPMIGSIPFVGYVFELENAADTATFIKTLEDNANLRWNICVTADEMVSGSVGNRVFFVMAPLSFDAK